MAQARSFFRKIILWAIKLVIAGCLIGWLIHSEKLDPQFFWKLWSQPELLATSILIWFGASLTLSAWRWQILLRGTGTVVPTQLIVALTSIGLFFNSVMPGAIGGDVLKGWYIYRNYHAQSRHGVLLTILLDRVLGVLALFVLGACASVAGLLSSQMPTHLLGWCGTTLLMGLAIAAALVCISIGWVPFAKIWSKIHVLKQCIDAVQMQSGRAILMAAMVSIGVQSINLFGYWMFVASIFPDPIPWASVFIVLPFAILSTALPLAPGGAGVGHMSFDFFFQQIGLDGGANIFNLYFVGQMALNLTGGIVFLFFRKELFEFKE